MSKTFKGKHRRQTLDQTRSQIQISGRNYQKLTQSNGASASNWAFFGRPIGGGHYGGVVELGARAPVFFGVGLVIANKIPTFQECSSGW